MRHNPLSIKGQCLKLKIIVAKAIVVFIIVIVYYVNLFCGPSFADYTLRIQLASSHKIFVSNRSGYTMILFGCSILCHY